MSYYIVFQNKTYHEELAGGYLWAPKKTSSGKEIFHWSNMTKVKKGDIIFSMYKRKLVSVNTAKDRCIDANRPTDLDSINLWEKEGWIINTEYNVLKNPIAIDDYIEEILDLCQEKYAPFTKQGKGSQGYLFEISNEMGKYLLELASNKNDNIDSLSKEEKEYIEDMESLLNKFKDETEKETTVKTRVGQGLFKNKLLSKSCECKLCRLNIKELLIASHCKPWKVCNNKERLDVNNGMLLCPTHDALFDKGLITFDDEGNIKISDKINENQFELLNINKNMKIDINEKQLDYIAYHREVIFK